MNCAARTERDNMEYSISSLILKKQILENSE